MQEPPLAGGGEFYFAVSGWQDYVIEWMKDEVDLSGLTSTHKKFDECSSIKTPRAMCLVLCVRTSWRTFWVMVMVWAMLVKGTGIDPGNHLSKGTKEAAYWHHNSCLFLIYCIIYCIMWWKVGTVGGLSPPKAATSQYTTHSWEGPIASDQWPVHCLANEKLTQEVSTKQEDLEENVGAVTERGRQRCIFLDLIVRKVVALETKHVFHECQTISNP